LQKQSTNNKNVIVISGTPGTGKTTIARKLAKTLNGIHIDLSELVLREKLYIDYDEERKSFIINEEAVINKIKEIAKNNRDKIIIIDSHYGEIVPKELVRKIIVLRLDPFILEKRLRSKSWNWNKVKENVAAEILGICTSNAIAEHGIDKVYEIDTSNKGIDEVIEEIMRILRGEGKPGPRIDWLSIKDFDKLRKYLE